MPKGHQRAAAKRDLVEHFVYLAENAGLDTAERFLTNAEASFNHLAAQPHDRCRADAEKSRADGIRGTAGLAGTEAVLPGSINLLAARHLLTICGVTLAGRVWGIIGKWITTHYLHVCTGHSPPLNSLDSSRLSAAFKVSCGQSWKLCN